MMIGLEIGQSSMSVSLFYTLPRLRPYPVRGRRLLGGYAACPLLLI